MRILVLCRRVPYPLTDGESLRIFNYAQHLSAGNELDLVCAGDASAVDPAVRAVFKRVEVVAGGFKRPSGSGWRRWLAVLSVGSFAPTFPSVRRHLDVVLGQRQYDVVWTSTDMVRAIPPDCGVPVLTDVCDDDALLLRRELVRTRGLVARMRLWKRLFVARRFERRYYAPTDACLFVSDADADSFRALAPAARIEVIPNGVDAAFFAPLDVTPDPATIVFEGSMDFEPNVDAAVYLCTELLPLIHARRPDVKVLLVGRDPSPAVRALASDAVTVTGRVDDVRPYVARASVFVCPLRMGAGIKNKVLQAWSMGKAVLATTMSIGGLECQDGANIVVRDGADALVDELLRMLDDPARCAQIGQRARDTVLGSYRWEARSAQFERLLHSVSRPRAARAALGRPLRARGGTGQRRVLMFALQFPPYGLSTGRLRTLGFARHLPAAGWVPIVVTARSSAYENRDDRTLAEIPEGTRVVRAAGVDMARLTAIRGVYPRLIATPDRWNTWALGAAYSAVRAARQCRVDALWLTFPVPSAVLAGLVAHRLSGLPLVADLRDPMVYSSWPELGWERAVYAWLERRLVKAASVVVLTTPGACDMYRRRYPHLPARRFREIPNGIDDGDAAGGVFAGAEPDAGPLTLLHSGLIEVPDRDPAALFVALQMLMEQRRLPVRGLRIVLRASGRDERFAADVRRLRIEPLVVLAPRLPHREAMQEMQRASALLLLQGTPCNQQIPAKAYEYLAARRPIVGLMDPRGDTHALVNGRWQVPYCADLADPVAIAGALQRFIEDHEAGRAYVPPDALVDSFRRRNHASELAQLLDDVVDERAPVATVVGQGTAAPLDRELS